MNNGNLLIYYLDIENSCGAFYPCNSRSLNEFLKERKEVGVASQSHSFSFTISPFGGVSLWPGRHFNLRNRCQENRQALAEQNR